ncbi:MAG: hypothetical protein M3513_04735 [Actinomycetota bacterium]|nr:hypothetical protein [Actinomycetota bacterium]
MQQLSARTTGQVARRHRTPTSTVIADAPSDAEGGGMTGRGVRSVATALAGAFLAGDWTRQGLLERGTATFDRTPRWLLRLVPEVLSLYRDPPADRPRELAAVIATAAGPAWAEDRREGRPLRVVRHLVEPTTMAPRRWPVAPLDTVAELADLLDLPMGHLLWYADTSGMQRRARAPGLHLYRYRWLPRQGRTPRLLEVPRPRLRRVNAPSWIASRVLFRPIRRCTASYAAAAARVAPRRMWVPRW